MLRVGSLAASSAAARACSGVWVDRPMRCLGCRRRRASRSPRDDRLHAESLGEGGDSATQRAVTNDAKRQPVQIDHRFVQQTKRPGRLPLAAGNQCAVTVEPTAQRQHQREDMLGHRVRAVIANVGDTDAAFARGLDVHVVAAGRRQGNQPERRQLLELRTAKPYLVDQRDIAAAQAFDDLPCAARAMQRQLTGSETQGRHVQVAGIDRAVIEKCGSHGVPFRLH